MSTTRPPIWVVLRANFLADPRKTVILVVLAVVMVVVYWRMFRKSGRPQAASASAVVSLDDSADTPPAVAVATGTGSPTGKRISLPGPLLRELVRDPFTVQLNGPGPDTQGSADPASTSTDHSIGEEAGELVLQSTICGAKPLACINGQVVRPGEQIGGFVLESVHPTQVLLRRGQVQVLLNLR